MNGKSAERKQFEMLDALADKSARKFFAFSPNDVLVQISLPLVLILAIATRLMVIGESLAAYNKGPVILDLWKQQLVLRVETVMEKWEKDSGLTGFPDFNRVLWTGPWPEDTRFSLLCRKGQALADINLLKETLYNQALQYKPDAATGAASNFFGFMELYDPRASVRPLNTQNIPAELIIDESRRNYALRYIEERCRKWRTHLENLQWNTIDKIASQLPLDDAITDRHLPAQMRKLAQALEQRGYPLLPTVLHEYEQAQ